MNKYVVQLTDIRDARKLYCAGFDAFQLVMNNDELFESISKKVGVKGSVVCERLLEVTSDFISCYGEHILNKVVLEKVSPLLSKEDMLLLEETWSQFDESILAAKLLAKHVTEDPRFLEVFLVFAREIESLELSNIDYFGIDGANCTVVLTGP